MRRTANQTAIIEQLPARRLLAVALSGEQLFVTGTSAGDHIMISLDAIDASKLNVNVNGDEQTFDRTAVSSIIVLGGAGRDHIIVDESNGEMTIPITLMGNGGSDLLIGGSGDDVIYGGAGKDRIVGGAGNDLIFGGSGRDLIAGGDGADTIVAGTGDDAVTGDAGSDSVIGGQGDDYIDSGAGNDSVNGGGDYDSITGGAGNDDLSGGKGDDDIDGGVGANTVTGGAGDDSFAESGDASNNTITDKTDGSDRVYEKIGMDFIPQQYHNLFQQTFPNSVPIGVRLNDDHTFVMLYKYNGDGTVYHAYFTFTGDDPFADPNANHDGVNLVSYEVAPGNLPPETHQAFVNDHPDAVIKDVFADHDGDSKFALIRYTTGAGESKVAKLDWMDSGDENATG